MTVKKNQYGVASLIWRGVLLNVASFLRKQAMEKEDIKVELWYNKLYYLATFANNSENIVKIVWTHFSNSVQQVFYTMPGPTTLGRGESVSFQISCKFLEDSLESSRVESVTKCHYHICGKSGKNEKHFEFKKSFFQEKPFALYFNVTENGKGGA
jgi:hypothetical protein